MIIRLKYENLSNMISDNNNDNLKFKKVRIQFYPEDERKMKNMTIEERIQYKQKLKAENMYISLDDF